MRRIITIILLGIPPLLLMYWDDRHGHHAPKWLLLLSAAPLAIALWLYDDDDEKPGSFANFMLLLLGLCGMAMGIVCFALKELSPLYGVFAWSFFLGLAMVAAAVVRGLRS